MGIAQLDPYSPAGTAAPRPWLRQLRRWWPRRRAADLRRAQSALRASEQKVSIAFEHAPLALCITALESNKLVDANQSLLTMGGYRRDEVLGRTPDELGWWVQPQLRHQRFEQLRCCGNAGIRHEQGGLQLFVKIIIDLCAGEQC